MQQSNGIWNENISKRNLQILLHGLIMYFIELINKFLVEVLKTAFLG